MLDGAAESGPALNLGKLELLFSGGNLEEQPQILTVFYQASESTVLLAEDGFTSFESPMLRNAILARLQKATAQAKTMTSRLYDIKAGLSLIQSSAFSAERLHQNAKASEGLRCFEPWRFHRLLNDFNDVIRRAAEKLTNVDMSGLVWKQAVLPVTNGGLGVKKGEGNYLQSGPAGKDPARFFHDGE